MPNYTIESLKAMMSRPTYDARRVAETLLDQYTRASNELSLAKQNLIDLEAKLKEVETERDEFQFTYKLMSQASRRACQLWREKHPDQDYWPDQAENMVWLVEYAHRAHQAWERLATKAGDLLDYRVSKNRKDVDLNTLDKLLLELVEELESHKSTETEPTRNNVGLYQKFVVRHADGSFLDPDDFIFVLNCTTDASARAALAVYAAHCRKESPSLADQLEAWLTRTVESMELDEIEDELKMAGVNDKFA